MATLYATKVSIDCVERTLQGSGHVATTVLLELGSWWWLALLEVVVASSVVGAADAAGGGAAGFATQLRPSICGTSPAPACKFGNTVRARGATWSMWLGQVRLPVGPIQVLVGQHRVLVGRGPQTSASARVLAEHESHAEWSACSKSWHTKDNTQ